MVLCVFVWLYSWLVCVCVCVYVFFTTHLNTYINFMYAHLHPRSHIDSRPPTLANHVHKSHANKSSTQITRQSRSKFSSVEFYFKFLIFPRIMHTNHTQTKLYSQIIRTSRTRTDPYRDRQTPGFYDLNICLRKVIVRKNSCAYTQTERRYEDATSCCLLVTCYCSVL